MQITGLASGAKATRPSPLSQCPGLVAETAVRHNSPARLSFHFLIVGMIMARGTTMLMLLLFCGTEISANDWPRWRGENNDNLSSEKGLLSSWPEGGPPKVWQIQGLGRGYASVYVANGRIFTMGRKENQEYLIALDEKTGQELWRAHMSPGSKENGPNGTPTVDGDRVYAISFEGELVCCDVTSGEVRWRKNFPRDFGGKMMSMWGYSESPLVDGDRLVCTPGGPRAMLVALDKNNGRTIWRGAIPSGSSRGKDGAGYSSIVISQAGGTKQYVQLVGRGLISLSAANGKFLWGYNKIANTTANIPTPIVSGDYVFASTGYGDGGSALIEVKGSRRRLTPREVYYKDARTLQNHHGGMVLVGEHLYFGHGHNKGFPCCVELRTGRPVWGPVRGPGSDSAAITYADGHLYFRYQNGVVALIEATPDGYHLKGQFSEDFGSGQRWAQPVIANKKLYLRANDELACFDLAQ